MLNRPIKRYAQNKLSYLASIHWRAMLKKLTLRHLVHVCHTVAEWKMRRTTCKSRPFAFRIESATNCNLKCPLCPTTYRKIGRGQAREMSLKLFSIIHEKIEDFAWRITFYDANAPIGAGDLAVAARQSVAVPHLTLNAFLPLRSQTRHS